MADLQGTKVISQIVPPTTEDTFPTHDAIYGKGGWREVASLTERDNISRSRMRVGMIVAVEETDTAYKLSFLGRTKEEDVWEEFKIDTSIIREDIDTLKNDISSIKDTISQIKIPITQTDKSLKVSYNKTYLPKVTIWSVESDGGLEERNAKVRFLNNSTIEIQWNIGVNGFIIIN